MTLALAIVVGLTVLSTASVGGSMWLAKFCLQRDEQNERCEKRVLCGLRAVHGIVVAAFLASCGGQVAETPRDAFVDAVCSHASCPGWPEPQVCQYSYHAAMERLGAQDEDCIASATALVKEPGCGPMVQTVANDVVEGRCSK